MDINNRAHILLVEDEKTTAAFYSSLIRNQGYQITTCQQGQDALDLLRQGHEFDLVLLDLGLPDISGWEILNFIKQSQKLSYIPVVVVTATDDKVSFLKALQQGAEDYLIKPVDVDTLISRMQVMLRIRNLYKNLQANQQPYPVNEKLRQYMGQHMGPSLVINQLARKVERLLDHDATILLEGDAGTGKRFLAETIHRFSVRAKGQMVRLRCDQPSEPRFLSRLLGHEAPHKSGALEKALGGTLFLENVHALSPLGQLSVLHVIQDQHFQRLGGEQFIPANLRILVSTSKDLKQMVEGNLFREDLYYRLNVVSLKLPDLRSRLEDIPFLAGNYLEKQFGKRKKGAHQLTHKAIQALQAYSWKENVRELFEVLHYAGLMQPGQLIDAPDLPLKKTTPTTAAASPHPHTLAEQEQRLILDTLQRTGGNKSRAAQALGISRSTLYNKMSAWGIKG